MLESLPIAGAIIGLLNNILKHIGLKARQIVQIFHVSYQPVISKFYQNESNTNLLLLHKTAIFGHTGFTTEPQISDSADIPLIHSDVTTKKMFRENYAQKFFFFQINGFTANNKSQRAVINKKF